ncbi:MAG: M20 family metallopeptidase [Pseudonocardia sp.]|nr:M20 family metallopeptidase [Pseudonocardia sp.]
MSEIRTPGRVEDGGLSADARAALKRAALAGVAATADVARTLAVDIHGDPELSGAEHRSRTRCVEALAGAGFRVEEIDGVPTGFVATSDRPSPGPRIGLFAEYDALPEVGHGCGHQLIAGAVIGAGLGLAAVADRLPGTVVVFGCPAEETLSGKRAMIEAGAFTGLEYALSFHAHDETTVMTQSTGNRELHFRFTGTPSHASSEPWKGTSALDGALLTIQNVNALRQFVRDGVRIHGTVHTGTAHNVVPASATCTYGVRSSDLAELDRVVERVIDCARAGALASNTTVEVEFGASAEPVLSDPGVEAVARANLEALGETVTEWRAMASTDFGDVSRIVPAALVSVASWPPGTPFHSYEAAEHGVREQALAAMVQGARALAATAVDLATGHDVTHAGGEEN